MQKEKHDFVLLKETFETHWPNKLFALSVYYFSSSKTAYVCRSIGGTQYVSTTLTLVRSSNCFSFIFIHVIHPYQLSLLSFPFGERQIAFYVRNVKIRNIYKKTQNLLLSAFIHKNIFSQARKSTFSSSASIKTLFKSVLI